MQRAAGPSAQALRSVDRSLGAVMQSCTQAAAARRVLEATLTTAKRLQSIRKDAAVFADVLQEMVRTQLDSLTPGATTVVPAGWAYEKGSPPHICAVFAFGCFPPSTPAPPTLRTQLLHLFAYAEEGGEISPLDAESQVRRRIGRTKSV